MTDPKLEIIIEKLERVKVDVAVAIGNIPLQPQIKSIIEAIAALRSYIPPDSPKWISVKERLPEFQKDVLLCCGGTGITVGFFGEKNFFYEDPFSSFEGMSVLDYVTHWMPLPAPPEQAAVDALLGEGK